MEAARSVEAAFFPLDEELNLPLSGLTPHAQQGLVVLASILPFASAALQLETLLNVQVSKSTVRRLTEQAGACLQQWQDACAHPLSDQGPQQAAGSRLALATDGVLVPVVPHEWAEVKMTTIGEVGRTKQGEPHCEQLSYFARLADAQTFGDLASFEMRRRRVDQAKEVAALNDGAEWIVGFVQGHRADAVRILDFAHAAQYLHEIETLALNVGVTLPPTWASQQVHDLKQEGQPTCSSKCGGSASRLQVRRWPRKWPICVNGKGKCSIGSIRQTDGLLALALPKAATNWSCRRASKGPACIGTARRSMRCWRCERRCVVVVGPRTGRWSGTTGALLAESGFVSAVKPL